MIANPPTALLQGTLDLLILQALSFGPSHGYAVSTLIRQRADGTLPDKDAALYQALRSDAACGGCRRATARRNTTG